MLLWRSKEPYHLLRLFFCAFMHAAFLVNLPADGFKRLL